MVRRFVIAVFVSLVAARIATAAPPCVGDCGQDGMLSVDELVQGVNIALGNATAEQCGAFDADRNQKVTVDELVSGVNNALNGCPSFVGNYFGVVPLNDGQSATLNLTAQPNGQVTGSFVISDGAAVGLGSSAAVIGSGSFTGTFNLDAGTFSVTGSYLDSHGQTVPVNVAGTFPGVAGAGSVTIQVGGNSFPGPITTGDGSTPTPTRTQPPISTATPSGATPTSTPTPTVTPTTGSSGGQRLACAAGQPPSLLSDILLINSDGSGKVNLTNTNDFADRDPEWSPNGERIVWSAGVRDQNSGLRYHIFVMNKDGSGRTDLTPDESDVEEPSWSPDGNRIVFIDIVGRGRIKVVNADGAGLTTILADAGERFNSPHWSGNRIVFASTLHIAHDAHAEDLEIYQMNDDGIGITRVTNNTFRDEFPVPRPDGQRIAFQSYRPGGPQIWFINPNGTGETQPDTGFLPSSLAAYSQNGQQFAYNGALPFQGFFGGIIIANADASSPVGVPGTNGCTGFDLK